MRGLRARYHKHGKKALKRGMTNLAQVLRGYMLPLRGGLLPLVRKDITLKAEALTSMPRRRYIERANKLISGKLALDSIFKEEMEYSIDTLDWNVSYSKAATTHQTYLQALNPVGDLGAAFHYTNDKKYFQLAFDFVKSWYAFSKKTSSLSNEYIWEHLSVGLRTENILYFFLVGLQNDCFSNEEIKLISSILVYNGEFLAKDANYLENHNHGVYQDRALLYLSVAFNRPDWTEISRTRLDRQWKFLFNDEMVCVENSYTYQRINVDLFKDVALFSQKQGHDWGDALIQSLTKAQDFMGYALIPNGFCSPFGDTFMGDYTGYEALSPEGVMAYATSMGTKGTKPPVRSMAYPKAGYYFGREHWEATNFKDAVWTMFRSGYDTITHRQADDNSFMLYAKGYDIFVDSGLYTYMFRDPIRIYTRSANSHNTVIVDETSFCFQRTDCTQLCGIIHSNVNLERGYDYVVGYNALYLGVFHLRHFVFLENALFIYDEIESNHEHAFSQLFHCGIDTAIEFVGNQELHLTIGDTEHICKLVQLSNACDVEVINGKDEGAKYGIWSGSLEEYHYINTVKFNKRGKNTNFATTIALNDELEIAFNPAQKILSFNKNGEKKSVQLENFNKYDILPPQTFVMDSYEIIQEGSNFSFENTRNYKQPVEYAWYVISKATRKPVRREMYSKSPKYSLDFSELEQGDYSIRAFIVDSSKNKASQVICHIICANGEYSCKRELEHDVSWLTHDMEMNHPK